MRRWGREWGFRRRGGLGGLEDRVLGENLGDGEGVEGGGRLEDTICVDSIRGWIKVERKLVVIDSIHVCYDIHREIKSSENPNRAALPKHAPKLPPHPYSLPTTSPASPSAQPTASSPQIQSLGPPYSGYPPPNTHTDSYPTPLPPDLRPPPSSPLMPPLSSLAALAPTPADAGGRVPFRG